MRMNKMLYDVIIGENLLDSIEFSIILKGLKPKELSDLMKICEGQEVEVLVRHYKEGD